MRHTYIRRQLILSISGSTSSLIVQTTADKLLNCIVKVITFGWRFRAEDFSGSGQILIVISSPKS